MALTRYFDGLATKFDDFPPDFYGMKRAWVGAFTDFGGPDTEIPFTFWALFPIFPYF